MSEDVPSFLLHIVMNGNFSAAQKTKVTTLNQLKEIKTSLWTNDKNIPNPVCTGFTGREFPFAFG